MGSSSNRYAPRFPQHETKSSTKQPAPTNPVLGPENLLKTGFAQKSLLVLVALSVAISDKVSLKPKLCASATLVQKTSKMNSNTVFGTPCPFFGTVWRYQKWDRKIAKSTAKADPCNKQLQLRLFKQPAYQFEQEDLISIDFPAPESAHVALPIWRFAMQHHPGNIHQCFATSHFSATPFTRYGNDGGVRKPSTLLFPTSFPKADSTPPRFKFTINLWRD